VPIMMPQRKQSTSMGQIGTIVGAGVGAMTPAGPVAGAQTGGAIGGSADALNNGQKQDPQAIGAMGRRMQQMEATQPGGGEVARAESALASMTPEQQKAYGPALSRARKMEEMGYA
jgi:hypothetical protein